MKLLIHDLNEKEWEEVAQQYQDYEVISDRGNIKPCVGCFGCWLKTPGQCVIKDGYDCMGALIHKAEEVVVISRYTYGGFSSFVKNVMDRSIGWVLPYMEIIKGEMHHRKRYPEDKPITFIFRGGAFTETEKEKARAYVEAVCRNFKGWVKGLQFLPCEAETDEPQDTPCEQDKTILLNGSLRGNEANTRKFLSALAGRLDAGEMINLSVTRLEETCQELLSAGTLVLGMPLYVDGIPSQMLRVMKRMERHPGGRKKIYTVANMGFYESRQLKNLLSMVKDWCEKCGYEYCGGIAIGAGEMLKMFTNGQGPGRNVGDGLARLAGAIRNGTKVGDIYADAQGFPRWMYMLIANMNWPRGGKKNGISKKELKRQLTMDNL